MRRSKYDQTMVGLAQFANSIPDGAAHPMRQLRMQVTCRELRKRIDIFTQVSDSLVAGVLTLPTPLGIELSHDNRVIRETITRLSRYLEELEADLTSTPGSEPPPPGKRFQNMSLTEPMNETEYPNV